MCLELKRTSVLTRWHRAVMAGRRKGANMVSTRSSPPRGAKSAAMSKIVTHPTVAVVATNDANVTRDVVVGDATIGIPSLPPLWNAWHCGSCHRLHHVGDGGELTGPCTYCPEMNPVYHDIMLDPEQLDDLKNNPGMRYTGQGGGDITPRTPYGKNNGMSHESGSDESSIVDSVDGVDLFNIRTPRSNDDEDSVSDEGKTDQEMAKFSFYERLEHYMERIPIKEDNRKSVELAIMVEAGSNVREMSTMTKEMRSTAFLSEYLDIVKEIPDDRFVDASVRNNMLVRFKGMRRTGDMSAEKLHRKYESELTTLRKYSAQFGANIPSGTTQLHQRRRPVVAKLWVEKFPVRSIFSS